MDKKLNSTVPEEILRKGLSLMRAAGEDIPVPEDLPEIIGKTVDREFGRRRGRIRLIASVSSIAVAAAIAAVALVVPVGGNVPQDTFDDPAVACAEAVKALEKVGAGLGKGFRQARNGIDRVEVMTAKAVSSVRDVMDYENENEKND